MSLVVVKYGSDRVSRLQIKGIKLGPAVGLSLQQQGALRGDVQAAKSAGSSQNVLAGHACGHGSVPVHLLQVVVGEKAGFCTILTSDHIDCSIGGDGNVGI